MHKAAEEARYWPTLPLREVAEVWFSGVDKKITPNQRKVRLCNYLDVIRNLTIHDTANFMEATATEREYERNRLLAGDVVFTKDSEVAEEIADCALIGEIGADVVCGYHLAVARPRPERVLGAFLAEALRLPWVRHQFIRAANGAIRFGLTLDSLDSIEVPVPPLEVQQRIAEGAQYWDNGVQEAEQIVRAKRKRKAALVELMAFDPAAPKACIGDLAAVNPRAVYVPQDAVVSFIPMEAVSEFGHLIQLVDRQRRELGSGFTQFADGDVLVAKITPCFENGKGALARGLTGGVGFGTTEFHVVRPKRPDDADYVHQVTLTSRFRGDGERHMTGSAGQRRVPADFISGFQIAVHDAATRERAGRVFRTLDEDIAQEQLRLDRLRLQKRGLMQELMRGEFCLGRPSEREPA